VASLARTGHAARSDGDKRFRDSLPYISGDAGDLGREDVVCRGWVVQGRTTSASLLRGWRLVGVAFPQHGLHAGGRRARTVTGIVQIILRRVAAPAHLGQPLDVQVLGGLQQ